MSRLPRIVVKPIFSLTASLLFLKKSLIVLIESRRISFPFVDFEVNRAKTPTYPRSFATELIRSLSLLYVA
jgi:hypothetical protein